MLDAADFPDDITALKAMLIAAQAREVRKDERIERLEKLGPVDKVLLPMRILPSGGRHGDT